MFHHLGRRQKVIIMLAVMSGLFLSALDQTIVGTALPRILGEFHALKELSWVVTAYLLTSTISVPIAGKLSDIYGRRRLLLIGIFIFVAGSVLCGLSQNIWQLIGYRALQGFGSGVLFANAFAIIGDLFPPRERGRWQGVFGAVFGLSSLVGPLLGGYLTDGHTIAGIVTNWRWTFYINVPIGLIAFYLIGRNLPVAARKVSESIDYAGAALLSIGLAALILACSLGGTDGWAWGSAGIIGLISGSAAALAAFIWIESGADNPIIPLTLFKNQVFTITGIAMFIFGATLFGAIVYVPLFAQLVLGYSATNSGILMLPMVAGLTLSSIVVGRIVAATGKYKAFYVAGFAVGTVGIYLLSGLNENSRYIDLAWRMALAGLGIGIGMPLSTLISQNAVTPKLLGVATASIQLFRSVGSTIGVAIMGGVLNNILTQKLSDIQNDRFVQLAGHSSLSSAFAKIDINSVQLVLSDQGRAGIMRAIGQFPPALRADAGEALNHLARTLRAALAGSITTVFMISAALMVVAVIATLFLKELPLRHHDIEDIPPLGDA